MSLFNFSAKPSNIKFYNNPKNASFLSLISRLVIIIFSIGAQVQVLRRINPDDSFIDSKIPPIDDHFPFQFLNHFCFDSVFGVSPSLIYLLWNELIQNVRKDWEEGNLIPHLPPLTSDFEKGNVFYQSIILILFRI